MKQIFKLFSQFCALSLILSLTLISCKGDEVIPGPESDTTTFRVLHDSLVFDDNGGTKSLQIKCAKEWNITTVDPGNLLTISHSSGHGDAEVKVTLKSTDSQQDKFADIIVTDYRNNKIKIKVSQVAKRYLEVSQESISFETQSGYAEVEVQTNVDELGIEIEGSEWLSIEKKKNSTYGISVKFNTNKDLRAGLITLSSDGLSKTISVQQSKYTDRGVLMEMYNSMDGDNWKDVNWADIGDIKQWTGITVTSDRITAINLEDKGLNGILPEYINQLTELTELNLNRNAVTIDCDLPGLSKLESFKMERRSQNEKPMSGLLDNLLSISSIKEIYINNVNLSCAIPSKIGQAKNLVALTLRETKLQSSITPEIAKATSLKLLNIPFNDLTGEITPQGLPTSCVYVDLSHNKLTGALPSCIGQMSNLIQLGVATNRFNSEIPEWLCNLTKLEVADLKYNKLTGQIPRNIGNLQALESLSLSFNQLSGELPQSLGGMSSLKNLDIKDNQLSGAIDDAIKANPNYQKWVSSGYFCAQNGSGFTNCN